MTEKPKKGPGRPSKPLAERSETFSIRLVPELRLRVEEAAAHAGKSMTAEIVDRLVKSFDSVETVMLANRFLEFRLVEREIKAQREHLDELSKAAVVDAAYNDAREALASLDFHKARIAEDIQELTTAIDLPESEGKKREIAKQPANKKIRK